MAAVTHTSQVSIPWTQVITHVSPASPGGPEVVSSRVDPLALIFGLTIDTALWTTTPGRPPPVFVANFQITEVATGQRFNHYWKAPLTALPKFPSLWLYMGWAQAQFAGVGHGPFGPLPPDGMYLYRPYIEIVRTDNDDRLELGPSQFAVGDEHFIMCQTT
jgi:hypothetical protein